jgi:hypothetical protein
MQNFKNTLKCFKLNIGPIQTQFTLFFFFFPPKTDQMLLYIIQKNSVLTEDNCSMKYNLIKTYQ